MMKILQVFDFFSLPHGGGSVDVISKLSKSLADRGHEVTICDGDYLIDYEFMQTLTPLVNFKVLKSKFNRFGIYYMPKLKGLCIGQFDVIHFHCYRSYQNYILYKKAIKAGVPFIIDAHGSTVDHSGPKQVLRKMYDYVWGYDSLKHASKVISETEIGVKEWRKLGVPENKITLLHPFIDIHEFKDIDGIKSNPPYILYLGRIHKDKGLEFLIKAFAKLHKIKPEVILYIVGQDDGYKKDIIGTISNQGLELYKDVKISGFISGVNKLSALSGASMLIQPSKNEAGARPSLEAIMCWTPVIVTKDTGAGLEISKMDAGYLVGYGDVQGLADAMKYVLDNREWAILKADNGRRYIKDNLSVESQIVKYESLYKEVMG